MIDIIGIACIATFFASCIWLAVDPGGSFVRWAVAFCLFLFSLVGSLAAVDAKCRIRHEQRMKAIEAEAYPRFLYGERVVAIRGFYGGCEGTVVGESIERGSYVVEIGKHMATIKGEFLEEADVNWWQNQK